MNEHSAGNNSNIDPKFLERRLKQISEGLKEGVRREVKRLAEAGHSIYVVENGKVVALPPERVLSKPN